MTPLVEGENVLDVLFEGKVPVTIGHYSWRRCLELLLSSKKVPYVSDSDQRGGVEILRGLVEEDDVFAYHVWENTTVKGVVRSGRRVLTFEERREKRERLEGLEFDAFLKKRQKVVCLDIRCPDKIRAKFLPKSLGFQSYLGSLDVG